MEHAERDSAGAGRRWRDGDGRYGADTLLDVAELESCSPAALNLGGRARWRVRVVAELAEINSLHLRGEMRRAGADIELQGALEQAPPDADTAALAALRRALEEAETTLVDLELRRDRLLALLDALNAAEAAAVKS